MFGATAVWLKLLCERNAVLALISAVSHRLYWCKADIVALMATYNMRRKRKLQASPEKKKPEADVTPKKRLRTKTSETSSPLKSPFTNADDDSPTFATKSFYGGRRKFSVPSTSSSTTSSPVVVLSPLTERKLSNAKVYMNRKRTSSLTDSDASSPNSQASGYSKRVLRTRDSKSTATPGSAKTAKKRGIFVTKNVKGSLTPGPRKVNIEDRENTPVKKKLKSSGKKFFRTKSPASADKMVGSIVVRKGFNLKFVPKRLSGNLWKDTPKSKGKKKQGKTPDNKYPKLKMTKNKKQKASTDAFLWESEQSSGDGEISFPSKTPSGKTIPKPKTPKTDTKSSENTSKRQFASHVNVENCQESKCYKQTPNVSSDSKSTKVSSEKDTNSQDSSQASKSNLYNSCVSVKKCMIDIDNRSADSACHTNSSPQTSPVTVSLVSEPTSKKTESYSGSQDLFGFDSLFTEETEETSVPPSVCSDVSNTPTKETSFEEKDDETKKFFPIFQTKRSSLPLSNNSSPISVRRSLRSSPRVSPGFKFAKETDGLEQMIIDAGQKKIGAVQCEVCNMLYNQGDPTDEADHAKMHQAFLNALSFPGWKKERVVQEYPDTGSRVIMVLFEDPKYAKKKVEDINRVMSMDLGFPEQSVWAKPHSKVFLYINDEKEVEGCVVAESITEGYRVIPDSQSGSQILSQRTGRPWCCDTEPEEAIVGISRLWVYNKYRKRGVASRLVDTVRLVFEHGMMIEKDKVAFSDPTSDGKQFATKYCGTPSFLVYKYM